MINNVTLVGRLTKAVDLRYTGSGIAVAQTNLAVERPFTNQNGVRETDFIRIVIWRKAAENLSNFTTKGSLIGVTGRIQTRSYENNSGQKVYVTEVVCENVQYLEPKEVTDKRKQQNNQQGVDDASTNRNQNIGNTKDYPDLFEQNSDYVDISDDDLPF